MEKEKAKARMTNVKSVERRITRQLIVETNNLLAKPITNQTAKLKDAQNGILKSVFFGKPTVVTTPRLVYFSTETPLGADQGQHHQPVPLLPQGQDQILPPQ